VDRVQRNFELMRSRPRPGRGVNSLDWFCLEAGVASVSTTALKRYAGVEVLDCTHLVEFSRDHDHDLKRRLSESHRGSGS